MVYHAGNLLLDPIGSQYVGPANDVLVCRDLRSPVGMRYLLLLVHKREVIKVLLDVFDQSERHLTQDQQPYLLHFTQNQSMGFVFPYREERRLSAFGKGQLSNIHLREAACVNLVMECLSSTLPYPLLYLILTQDCIHLSKDGSIYFLPTLDLSPLSAKRDEGSCTSTCAQLLLDILSGEQTRDPKWNSYELIQKKSAKAAYNSFPELYHDIKVTSAPQKKKKLFSKLRHFCTMHKDTLFRILLVFCGVVVFVALLFLVSQLVFGDIPFLRLFERTFEVIGTENLT